MALGHGDGVGVHDFQLVGVDTLLLEELSDAGLGEGRGTARACLPLERSTPMLYMLCS